MIEIDLDKISKNELTTILIQKDKEIERLNNIINNAIEYMEDNSKISLDDTISIINFYRQLLEILKGTDKE